MKRSALSLTELVVVLAIIAIFGLIAFPAFSRARESARALVCKKQPTSIEYGFVRLCSGG